ncbi:hypothetical protein DID78_00920 [Candidatus Marinamargulisbacteria bacterium SCGC AG-343-D04]|nr:hypothetical protein DID78_00920 [Candidatus Marinamargulisbacteria bacterium SCGC AG-343-D04]
MRVLFFIVFLGFFYSVSIFSSGFDSLVNDLRNEGVSVNFSYDNFNPSVFIRAGQFEIDFLDQHVVGEDSVIVDYSGMNVLSNSVRYQLNKGRVLVENNVKITKDSMMLTCDFAEAILPDDLHSKGNVAFLYKDYTSQSGEAYYNQKSDVITFKDNVVLQQSGDFIRGDVVKFNMIDEKIISSGRSKIKISTERL